ncbi:phasin [Bradyrhizobium sp. PMVTL-01]|uniref:phasin n=1 Tax=unclassified Bradyrhizobium TaxID=2631580 RepID=UPI003F6EFF33
MSDANVKVETNAAPEKVGANGSAKFQFDVPFFNMQTMFGSFAEQGATRAQANFAKVRATSEEVTAALCDAYSTNAKRAADYGIKLAEISHTNTTSTLDFISQLADARSFADLVNLSTAHGRKTLEATSAQNRELWDLAQKVATETAEPIKQSLNRVLRSAA